MAAPDSSTATTHAADSSTETIRSAVPPQLRATAIAAVAIPCTMVAAKSTTAANAAAAKPSAAAVETSTASPTDQLHTGPGAQRDAVALQDESPLVVRCLLDVGPVRESRCATVQAPRSAFVAVDVELQSADAGGADVVTLREGVAGVRAEVEAGPGEDRDGREHRCAPAGARQPGLSSRPVGRSGYVLPGRLVPSRRCREFRQSGKCQ